MKKVLGLKPSGAAGESPGIEPKLFKEGEALML
jgi:hypothetical protein